MFVWLRFLDGGRAMSTELITLSEAAKRLGYSAWGLRKIVTRSKRREAAGLPPLIKSFQLARRGPIKFRHEWLDEFIEANSTVAVPPSQPPPAKRGKGEKGTQTPTNFNLVM
jgi:hypothetical protein